MSRKKAPPGLGRCTAITRAGKPCTAAPMLGTQRCTMHTGSNASIFGIRGGHRRTVFSPEGLVEFAPPENAHDIKKLMAVSLIELRNGKLDPRMASALSYLSGGFLRADEATTFEARMVEIEKKLGLGGEDTS
jgi:hypothetical protein